MFLKKRIKFDTIFVLAKNLASRNVGTSIIVLLSFCFLSLFAFLVFLLFVSFVG